MCSTRLPRETVSSWLWLLLCPVVASCTMRKRPCRHKLLHNWALCQQTMSNIVNPVARGTGHCRRGCDIVANTAAQGGGVAVVGGTAVALSRIVVEGNSASTRAGGLLVRGNTVVVSAGNAVFEVDPRLTLVRGVALCLSRSVACPMLTVHEVSWVWPVVFCGDSSRPEECWTTASVVT